MTWAIPIYTVLPHCVICHPAMMVPEGPRATRKRKAGSITSGYLEKEGKRSELDLYVPWLGYCDSRFGLPLSLTSSRLGG